MLKKIRKINQSKYECLYVSYGSVYDNCTYCGLPATSMDHVPPITRCSDFNKKALDYNNFFKVPSCTQCNSALNDRVLYSIRERLDFIKKYLRKKYKNLLHLPTWEEEDYEDMDLTFAKIIKHKDNQVDILYMRLDHYPEDNILNLKWETDD